LDPRFVGLSPAKDDGYLRAINICGMTSFGGEVKPLAPYCKILQHVKRSLQSMTDTSLAKLKDISCQLPALLLGVSAATSRELWWMNQE
jgi:hypothetical protein